MSEDEVESFEITDYDLDNEFNINRPRRKLSKKQQMLGIWADDSDEEDVPARPSFKSYDKGPKNYTAPVSFVAGGIQQAGKPKEEQSEEGTKDDDDDDDDDEDDDQRGSRRREFTLNSSSDSDTGTPRESRSRTQQPSFSINLDSDVAGLRRKKAPINPQLIKSGVGSWEVHTKGIGAKLLLRMGFEPGKGLGKQLQGISAPVEAHLRKGRGAIGAYGPEKVAKVPEKKKDEDIEEAKAFKAKLSQWRKGGEAGAASSKKRSRYVYRSVDQVLEDGKSKPERKVPTSSEISRVKVIDMTGPECRVLSGYHAIAGGQRRPDEGTLTTDSKTRLNFSLPELQHNLDLLVNMCEQDIIRNDRRTRYLNDRVVALEAENKNLTKVVDRHGQLIVTLENVLAVVDKLTDNSNDLSLEETAIAFRNLQDSYYEEYKMYELGELAGSLVSVKVKDKLATWNPLMHPKEYMQVFSEWKDILETGRGTLSHSQTMHPYDRLIWTAWMPSIRGAVQQWICKQPDPLIELIEYWIPLLPSWILENIIDLLVLPKLTLEVEEWNPLTDTVPIHTWIHPWLPLMRNRLDSLVYPIIRRKLGSAMGGWHPSDRSARLMLQPWVEVFDKGDMQAFLVKNIIPKLEDALLQLDINPHQQHLDKWNWVYEWKDMLSVHAMAGLLDNQFFPKWLRALAIWLSHMPSYEQVIKWYMGWKSMLSEKLLDEPRIKDHFKKALEMIRNTLVEPQARPPGPIEQVPYMTNLDQMPSMSQIPTMAQQRFVSLSRTMTQTPRDYKDFVQDKCEERGILFMPIPNRYKDDKQVYKLGNVQAYIDGEMLFVSRGSGTWAPIQLNAILEMAGL